MEPPSTHPDPAVLTKSSHLLAFEFCNVGLIILVNLLLLIPIVVNRNCFWPSYLHCLLSTIVSSILFAIIAIPVSILFGNSQQLILDSVLSCKTWSVVSYVLWDASIFSVIYLNADLIFSLMRPHIYIQNSYQSLIKFVLSISWICSFIINIWLVGMSQLETGHLNPIQPCLHVASREHFFVSSICGLFLILLTFVLCLVLTSNIAPPSLQIDQKLTCCVFPLLLLDVFIICLRVIPEVFHLILILEPNLFINPLDEKYLAEELEFISWINLFLLPVFWMLEPKVRQLLNMTLTCCTRSRGHEDTHPSSPEEDALQ